MDSVFTALEALFTSALDIEHWPFLCVGFTLAVIGQTMSTRVFTREQAYRKRGTSRWQRFVHGVFWWGRETLPAHPILAGLLISFVWPDPEGRGWSAVQNAAAWTFCGALSLFAWVVIKSVAKHRGVTLELPGESQRPQRRNRDSDATLIP